MKKILFMGVMGLFLLGSCNSKSGDGHEGHNHETEKHEHEGCDHDHEGEDHNHEGDEHNHDGHCLLYTSLSMHCHLPVRPCGVRPHRGRQ